MPITLPALHAGVRPPFNLGRILKVVDAGGRQWDPQPWVDDWGGGT